VVLHVSPGRWFKHAILLFVSYLANHTRTTSSSIRRRSSYNRVNGTHVSESKELLDDVLRKEWGWEGMVMSDWTGVYSSEASVKAGLDLEMP
jgi:hypothetical protein